MGSIRRHPLLVGIPSFILIWIPAAIGAIWAMFSSEPIIPTVAKKVGVLNTPDFSIAWLTGFTAPVGLFMLAIILVQTRRKELASHIAPKAAEDKNGGPIQSGRDDYVTLKAETTNQNSIATRVIVVNMGAYSFQRIDDQIYLKLLPEIHAIPGVRVEDIKLEMLGKCYETDWKPMKEAISGDIGEWVNIEMSKLLQYGSYTIRIIAIIENKEYLSHSITIDYQQSSLGREVYPS